VPGAVPPGAVAGFAVAVLPLVVTPGASLALLTRHVTTGGRRRAVPVVLGTATGIYTHATLALAGLSALVMRSSEAFAAVRLAGAAYLVGLGLWTWWSSTASGGRRPRPVRSAPLRPRRAPARSAYGQAFLGNLLNPKAASVYLTLVPQFLSPGRPMAAQVLAMAGAHIVLTATWLGLWTLFLGRVSAVPRRFTARIAALVLFALGVRSALVQ
jgi:threonine/homoserine/homoserine lactone efflux protein